MRSVSTTVNWSQSRTVRGRADAKIAVWTIDPGSDVDGKRSRKKTSLPCCRDTSSKACCRNDVQPVTSEDRMLRRGAVGLVDCVTNLVLGLVPRF